MKRFILALITCFLLSQTLAPVPQVTAVYGDQQVMTAIAQDAPVAESAKLVIEGPTKVKAGDLVVLSVEKSRAATFKWIVIPSTTNYLVIDNGKRVVFSSGSSQIPEFKFIVACSLGDTCDVAVHTVTVIGQTTEIVDSFESKIAGWCESVKSDTKRDDILKLAQSFSSVAMIMEGGTLVTPTDIVNATFKSNKDALGDKLDAWLPFREGLANELRQMSANGKLADTAAHLQVWKIIAGSLRNYAQKL